MVMAVSYLKLGTPWGVVLVFLGATIGPYMGVLYPFPVVLKAVYILGLASCLAGFLLGVKFRSNLLGQAAAVCSIVGWVVLGIVGLGTGT